MCVANFAPREGCDTMTGCMKQGETRSARWVALWCAAALLALSSACSAVVDGDKSKLGPMPIPCNQGELAPCPCRDGSMSVQRCNALLKFDRCMCAGVAGSGDHAGGAGRAGSAGAAGRAGNSGASGRRG
jgi:hypothetical protein